MTDFTDDQLRLLMNKLAPIVGGTKALILTEELRPAPKFADGQVVFRSRSNTYDTYKFSRGAHCRALTPTEMGPLVVKLVNAIADAGSADTPTPIYSAWKELINIHGGTEFMEELSDA